MKSLRKHNAVSENDLVRSEEEEDHNELLNLNAIPRRADEGVVFNAVVSTGVVAVQRKLLKGVSWTH